MVDPNQTNNNCTIPMDKESLPPLFIPLKSEYYEAFEDGSKTVEYRLHGNRWHRGTCWAGRPVTLSKGYGKKHRLSRVIKNVWLTDSINLDPYIQIAIAEIYGAGQHGIICIELEKLK